MKLHVLFGQRLQEYPGQFAPEALEVIDEYANDENDGVWMHEKLHANQATGDFEALHVIEIEISRESLDLVFAIPKLRGKIDSTRGDNVG